MSSNEPKSLESIGHLCQTFQASYSSVRRALDDVGAMPAVVINGVPHYAEGDVERAGQRIAEAKARRGGGQ